VAARPLDGRDVLCAHSLAPHRRKAYPSGSSAKLGAAPQLNNCAEQAVTVECHEKTAVGFSPAVSQPSEKLSSNSH